MVTPPARRQVTFLVKQGLGGGVDGNERGGAGGLNVDAGAAQIEQKGDAGGEKIFVIAGMAE